MSRKQRAMYCEMDEPGRCTPAAAAQLWRGAGGFRWAATEWRRSTAVAAVFEHVCRAIVLLLLRRRIAFPKAHRRSGRLQRFAASVFGCFVPPPDSRSPAPSMRAAASNPSFQFQVSFACFAASEFFC
jgi:hypothetical protein